MVDDWKIEVRQQHIALITPSPPPPVRCVYNSQFIWQSLQIVAGVSSLPFDVYRNGMKMENNVMRLLDFNAAVFVCNGCRFVCDTFVSNSFSVSGLLHSDFLF